MAVNAGRGPQTAVALGGVTESRMPFYLAPNRSNKSPRDGKEKKRRAEVRMLSKIKNGRF